MTPRRRRLILVAGILAGVAVAGGLALQIPDDPCWVFLSTSGQLARTPSQAPLVDPPRRIKHDALASVVRATARSEIGAVTSAGRMLRVQVMDVPVLTAFEGTPKLGDGVPVKEFLTLGRGERLVGLAPLGSVLALGTRNGVVKRVTPEHPLNREEWEVITLKDGDEVVGLAESTADDDELVFVSRDGKLLHFDAGAVRPQGRTGGGVAGIKLVPGDAVVFFGAVRAADETPVVVTLARADEVLPGMSKYSVKVTPFAEYPPKGRATGGVRAHRFLKGETGLVLAWAGHGPAKAVSATGVARALPTEHGRRDGSGVPTDQVIDAVGPAYS